MAGMETRENVNVRTKSNPLSTHLNIDATTHIVLRVQNDNMVSKFLTRHAQFWVRDPRLQEV